MRSRRLFWLLALASFLATAFYPVATRWIHLGELVLFALVWFGLIALCWHRIFIRWLLLALTLVALGLFALPARTPPTVDTLRSDYVTGLRRYEGVRYFWGGENIRGIDCSGLVRCGLIDALFLRGLRNLDGRLLREAVQLWWHDTSADTLRKPDNGLTHPVLATPSLVTLDHSQLQPGDLAVTNNGLHILAYVGNHRWIEADPEFGSVVEITVTSTEAANSTWFKTPVRVVRWNPLTP